MSDAAWLDDQESWDLFTVGHFKRTDGKGIPNPIDADAEAWWEILRGWLREKHVSAEDADAASIKVARRPPMPSLHRSELVDAAMQAAAIRRARLASKSSAVAPVVTDEDRAWADAESRWNGLTDEQRDTRRRRVRRENPAIRWKGMIEALCVESLMRRETARGGGA